MKKKKTEKKKVVEYHHSPGKIRRRVEGRWSGERREGGEGDALLTSSPLLHPSAHAHTHSHIPYAMITSDKPLVAFFLCHG